MTEGRENERKEERRGEQERAIRDRKRARAETLEGGHHLNNTLHLNAGADKRNGPATRNILLRAIIFSVGTATATFASTSEECPSLVVLQFLQHPCAVFRGRVSPTDGLLQFSSTYPTRINANRAARRFPRAEFTRLLHERSSSRVFQNSRYARVDSGRH